MEEKSLARLLIETTIVSLVAMPLTIIGMGIGGYIWSEKIVPKLDGSKKKKTRKRLRG